MACCFVTKFKKFTQNSYAASKGEGNVLFITSSSY